MPITVGEPLLVPVSAGELLDKKTILEIKRERMADASQRANVERELQLLTAITDSAFGNDAQLLALQAQLKTVNEQIWDLENKVRVHERQGNFGDDFIRTARTIYATNDQRAALKREVNRHLNSPLVEEKSHT